MGWRAAVVSVLLCGEALSRPSLLGAAPGVSSDHHHGGHQEQADDYYDENSDRSYSFEFTGDSYNRKEAADSAGTVEGTYSYKTAAGNSIQVQYKAGQDTGFIIQNMDELLVALEAAAAEASLVKAAPYSGETAEISFQGPVVDLATSQQDSSYQFGFKTSKLGRQETADAVGNVHGSYFLTDADGETVEVRYRAGSGIGFVVDNLDEVVAKLSPLEKQAVAPSVIASRRVSSPLPATSQHNSLSLASYQSESVAASSNTVESQGGQQEQTDDYYDEDSDRSYSFQFTGDNYNREEVANSVGTVEGKYSYKTAGGNNIKVQFRAGQDTGFVIQNKEELLAALEAVAAEAPLVNAAPYSGETAEISFQGPVVDLATSQQDRSYNFGYKTSKIGRQETSDAAGNLHGSYSLTDVDGKTVEVRYRAGAGIGFVVDNLDEVVAKLNPPEMQAVAPSVIATRRVSSPLPATSQHNSLSLTSYQSETVAASSNTFESQEAQQEQTDDYYDEDSDRSYSFQFTGDNYNRKEVADSVGTVEGEYSYKTPGGNNIKVEFTAGQDTGFIIQNKEDLLAALEAVAAEAPLVKAAPYSGETAEIIFQGPVVDLATSQQDSSYNFGFKTSKLGRQETADAVGNVHGSYSLIDSNGKPVEVRYRAGSDIGFVVDNLDDVVTKLTPNTNEVSARSVLATRIVPSPVPASSQQNSYQLQAVAASSSTVESQGGFQKQTDDYYDEDSDRSYSFEFAGDNYNRQEVADSEGKVKGKYSYKTPGGNNIKVEYNAGQDTGFVIQNMDELLALVEAANAETSLVMATDSSVISTRLAPSVPVVVKSTAQLYEAPPAQVASPQLTGYQQKTVATSSYNVNEQGGQDYSSDDYFDEKSDRSFNFGFSADNYNREEVADSEGTVQGSYSYKTAGGNNIQVQYKAGKDTGFVIQNMEELLATVSAAAAESPLLKAVPVSEKRADISIQGPLVNSGSHSQVHAVSLPLLSAPATLYGAPLSDLPSLNSIKSASSHQVQQDASFKFNVNEADQTFTEESDRTGERMGSYTYINPEGETVEVRYTAGRGGFVILNPDQVLPKAPLA